MSNAFFVADSETPPVLDGVPIPEDAYNTRKEVVLDLSMTNVKQFQGILSKYNQIDFSKPEIVISK